ncbi:Fe-S cluster assembly protein SufD [Aristophania vespae]|uniref:Fe-S cluster assembly protein SufD n=1 Tax=Aristophania vespae TaxID=2697033 RepID=UPI0023516C2A|nr:Fe-S cluster assembly protein SufD [Aristophania vespae]
MSNALAWDSFERRAGKKALLTRDNFLPKRITESWRYTPMQSLSSACLNEAERLNDTLIQTMLNELKLPQAESLVVFANGHRADSHTTLTPSLSFKKDLALKEEISVSPENFSFLLNSSLSQSGLNIIVPAHVKAGTLILVSLTEGDEISTHLRHKIILEEGASLTLLDLSYGNGAYVSNPVFLIECAKDAHLKHIKLQKEGPESHHLAFISASIDEGGNYESFTQQQGAKLARHEVKAKLLGEHAIAHVNGVQLGEGQTHHDLTSLIIHEAPHCQSRQTVKTVLSDKATGVFQGKIFVDQKAQKTDGYQMNQALLLSETAQMNSKPELEIYADDVRCSHGATVGALDEEQLFYLQSRGIPKDQARSILIQAFLHESLSLLNESLLREYLIGSLAFHA